MAEHPDGGTLFYLPAEHEGGVYANAFSIWHSGHELTIDFAATQRVQPLDFDDPDSPLTEPARIVARIRIAPTLAFELIQAVNGAMTRYEADWGEIVHPRNRKEGA